MFKRLIIATDLSKDSKTLIDRLGGLKIYGAEECVLLQILSLGETIGIDDLHKTAAFTEFGKILQNQKDILEKQGYRVETGILPGFPIKATIGTFIRLIIEFYCSRYILIFSNIFNFHFYSFYYICYFSGFCFCYFL